MPDSNKEKGVRKNCIFIQSNFICGPCSEWLRYGCGNTLCLEEISPNKVAEKIFF